MTWSRFPCFECAAPFDDEPSRDAHQRAEGHGFAQVQLDAIDRARWGVMGDDAPPPESAHADDVYLVRTLVDAGIEPDSAVDAAESGDMSKIVMQHTTARRRNLRIIQGGRG